ncbi:MAG: hypothetical protein R3A46_10890 [Thermomicrobiales bacterium]
MTNFLDESRAIAASMARTTAPSSAAETTLHVVKSNWMADHGCNFQQLNGFVADAVPQPVLDQLL